MPITRLNHAVLYVRDAARSAQFYADVLGFRRIIEDHGGRITVSAQDGEGTCFVLSLADARAA